MADDFRPSKDIGSSPTPADIADRDELIVMLLRQLTQVLGHQEGLVDTLNSVVEQIPHERMKKIVQKKLKGVPEQLAKSKSSLIEQFEGLGYEL